MVSALIKLSNYIDFDKTPVLNLALEVIEEESLPEYGIKVFELEASSKVIIEKNPHTLIRNEIIEKARLRFPNTVALWKRNSELVTQ